MQRLALDSPALLAMDSGSYVEVARLLPEEKAPVGALEATCF